MANNKYNTSAMKDIQGYFREGQREAIYREAQKENKLRDLVLFRLLWKSGRRISEVLLVKVKDIDFNNRLIYWNILKKGKPLAVWKPIDTKTLELLSYYIEKYNGLLLPDHFLLHNGNPLKHISRQRADQILQRYCKKLNIRVGEKGRPHLHHFRHSFAIDLVRKAKTGSGIRITQQALEHSSLNMTEQYLQFSPEELRDLIEDDG